MTKAIELGRELADATSPTTANSKGGGTLGVLGTLGELFGSDETPGAPAGRSDLPGGVENPGVPAGRPTDATTLDQLPPEEREEILAAQAAAEAEEAAARDAAAAAQQPPPYEEIAEIREEHYEEYGYYIDEHGVVYAAEYNAATGEVVLQRDTQTAATAEHPAFETSRTAVIALDDSREDISVSSTIPTGAPGETNETITERVSTDPAGVVTHGSREIEQITAAEDGTVTTTAAEERFEGPDFIPTQREHSVTVDRADGSQVVDATHTNYQPGTGLVDNVTTTHSERQPIPDDGVDEPSLGPWFGGPEDTGPQFTETSRETITHYAADGATPTSQYVTEAGTDQPTVRSDTQFDEAGLPATTYVRTSTQRTNGDEEWLTHETDFVVWAPDGQIAERYQGSDVTRAQYEADAVGSSHDGRFEYDDNHGWRAVDPALGGDLEQLQTYTRQGDNRFDAAGTDSELIEPLIPTQDVPSVFELPAELQAAAASEAIDQSVYATDPAAYAQLNQEQASFEQQLAATTDPAQREALMQAYFAEHDYWIQRGASPDQDVLVATAWSNGAPPSEIFGGDRAQEPHAVLARTGIPGVDDLGQPATVDWTRNWYPDGSADEVTRTEFSGPAGASRVTVTGEHYDPEGDLTERAVTAESTVPRVNEGLPPLSVTEVSHEHFTGVPNADGLPVYSGEQYYAVATHDALTTSLEERVDTYGADGVIDDTQIESVHQSRDYDDEVVDDFLAANDSVLDAAGADAFDVNGDGTEITAPAPGSYHVTTSTDIDYDANGQAIYQSVEEDATTVEQDAGDTTGVTVTTVESTRESGARGGAVPIFDAEGNLVVNTDVVTTVSTSSFDADDGQAGGNGNDGHQFRETTSITTGATVEPDGDKVEGSLWSTPLEVRSFQEGFDDDWAFVDRQYLTAPDGTVLVDRDGAPRAIGFPSDVQVYDETGELVEAGPEHWPVEVDHLDAVDDFEAWVDGVGGRVLGIAGVVVGVAGAFFTGGASLALAAAGIALALPTAIKSALDYRQGEASLGQFLLNAATVPLAGLGALSSVRQLATAGRLSANSRLGAFATSRAGAVTNTGAEVAGTGVDVYDGVEAVRAAMQGNYFDLSLLGAALGGSLIGGRYGTSHAPGTPGATPPSHGAPGSDPTAPGTGATPEHPGAPSAGPGAPGVGPGADTPHAGPTSPGPGSGQSASSSTPTEPSATPPVPVGERPAPGASRGEPSTARIQAPGQTATSQRGPVPTTVPSAQPADDAPGSSDVGGASGPAVDPSASRPRPEDPAAYGTGPRITPPRGSTAFRLPDGSEVFIVGRSADGGIVLSDAQGNRSLLGEQDFIQILGAATIRTSESGLGRIAGRDATGQLYVQDVQPDGSLGQPRPVDATAITRLNADALIRQVAGAYETNAHLGGPHAIPRPDLLNLPGARRVEPTVQNFGSAGGVSFDYVSRGGWEFDLDGVVVRVESPDAVPSQHVADTLAAIEAAIRATPPQFRPDLQRINVFEGKNPADPYWAVERQSPNFHSGATALAGQVNFWTGRGHDTTSTFQHEVGHLFHHSGGPNDAAVWHEAARLDQEHIQRLIRDRVVTSQDVSQWLLVNGERGVSQYADDALASQKLYVEDFAEAFRLALLDQRQGSLATRTPSSHLPFQLDQSLSFRDLFPHRADVLEQWLRERATGGTPGVTPPDWYGPSLERLAARRNRLLQRPGQPAGPPSGATTTQNPWAPSGTRAVPRGWS